MSDGILSQETFYNACRNSSVDVLLKGAVILYPRVACWSSVEGLDLMAERLGAGMNSKERKALRRCFVTARELDASLDDQLDNTDVLQTLQDLVPMPATTSSGIDPAKLTDFQNAESETKSRHPIMSLHSHRRTIRITGSRLS